MTGRVRGWDGCPVLQQDMLLTLMAPRRRFPDFLHTSGFGQSSPPGGVNFGVPRVVRMNLHDVEHFLLMGFSSFEPTVSNTHTISCESNTSPRKHCLIFARATYATVEVRPLGRAIFTTFYALPRAALKGKTQIRHPNPSNVRVVDKPGLKYCAHLVYFSTRNSPAPSVTYEGITTQIST